jgi:hypothetical protein
MTILVLEGLAPGPIHATRCAYARMLEPFPTLWFIVIIVGEEIAPCRGLNP